jgi:predicted metalloendopeptidase
VPPRRLLLRPLLTVAALAVVGLAPVLTSAQSPAAGGVDQAGMDRSVKPGDDFFAFANGTWARKTEIPPDRASWGSNNELADLTDKRVADLIQAAGAAPGAGKAAEGRKAADYYAAYMDEAGIEAKGLTPLKAELARIAAIDGPKALSAYLGSTVRVDVDMLNNSNFNSTPNLLGLWIAADLDQPTRYAPFVVQGGLSLPNRDYYLQDSARMKDIRAKFQAHAAKVLTLAGVKDAQAKAASILALETAIARAHAPTVDIEDPVKGNNHWRRADFAAKAPGLDWTTFLAAAGLPASQQSFVIWTPSAIVGEAALVRSQPLETWKALLAFHLIDRWSNLLPKAFVDERFDFYGRTLSGTSQMLPRWKRAVASTNGALGEAVGKLYAAKYFPPADKAAVQQMVTNIKAAFDRRIDALAWMAPATKREAHAKVDALIVGVGYPDKWRDYSRLVISPKDALGNAHRAELFDSKIKIGWLAKPVDRREWVMTPQTVNAVNLPVLNALNFPAAELQPPHFDPKAPSAANYGSVGAIIGHEISHSFDNNGAEFDSKGRMRDWWTKADFAHFDASGKALARQYDAYCPFPDLCVRGEQTLSENIADLAGLSAAYDAWKTSLGGKPAPQVDGMSGDQQFFVAFAQAWRSKSREPALRQQILTNGHAPSALRAQTVRNLDPWYAAFAVAPGQKLYLDPKARVRVW